MAALPASELESFVLAYLKQAGGLVEPAAPVGASVVATGRALPVYEVLLPDSLAEEWRVPPYLQIAFADTDGATGLTRLGYNHPLVEEIVTAARSHSASTRYYIDHLRLSKSGLVEMARENWALPNSRIVDPPGATVGRYRSTYVRFNFKAALTSDEKQERLVSVLMDAHSGAPAADPARIERMANATRPENVLKALPNAPIRWTAADGHSLSKPLVHETLAALLVRAKTAILDELAEPLRQLEQRTRRFRELDEARLTEYYDDIRQDLQQRLATASLERRGSLEEKLAATAAERAAKLADVAGRYHARLDLTLLNLLVIVQPKLIQQVRIENRMSSANAHAVYDPLLHRLEPLICAVCGQSSQRTYLCYNGHLAHVGCLAPACVDCKRIFCALCANEVGQCDVCHKALCRYSRIACAECGRGTCQAHVGMCHANEGQPVELESRAPALVEPKPAPPPEPPQAPKAKPKRPVESERPAKRPSPTRKPSRPQRDPAAGRPLAKGLPKPQRIEVVVTHDAVVAYVLASRERQLAMRVWELVPDDGILITCQCELGQACPANERVMRPAAAGTIEKQILDEITRFRQEYGLPAKKVGLNRSLGGQIVPVGRFGLYGRWKDPDLISQAQASFDRRYRRW